MKFLGEHGWEPVVLTAKVDRSQVATDNGLEQQMQSAALVSATANWRPLETRFGLRRRVPTTAGTGTAAPSHGPQRQDRSAKSRRRKPTVRRKLAQLFFETPDPKIWWALPAIPTALRLIRRTRPQVIFSTAPPHSSHVLALVLGKLCRLPVVLDFRDPWARNPWRDSQAATLNGVDNMLEQKCVRGAAAVLLNTQRSLVEFKQHYSELGAERFFYVPNGYDPDLLANCAVQPEAGQTRRQRILTHPGALYGRRDVRPLLQAINQLKASGTELLFQQIGVFRQDFDVQGYIRELQLEENFCDLGQQPHEVTLRHMTEADFLLLLQPDTPLQVPGKLYEFLMFRKPILALTSEGETADIIRRYRLGVIADPKDSGDIVRGLDELYELRSRNWRPDFDAALQAFNGRNLTAQLAQIFERVRKPRDRASGRCARADHPVQ